MLERLDSMQAPRPRPATAVRGRLGRVAMALVPVIGGLVWWASPVAAAAPVTVSTAIEAGVGHVVGTATVAGGDNPTGTVTFRVFGPGDDTCARSPLLTSTNPVMGAGDPKHATSDRFVLRAPGVYHFVATFNGDARNPPSAPSACADPNAAYGFGSSHFSFSARASGPTVVGGTVSDTATISMSSQPTGTMRFELFGPDVATCTGTPVFTSARPVEGNGSYTSDPFVPVTPGVYRWVARYSGDPDGPSAATACNDPAQRVEVRASGGQCIVSTRPWGALAAYRQVLQALGDNPIAAFLARLAGSTACWPARPLG